MTPLHLRLLSFLCLLANVNQSFICFFFRLVSSGYDNGQGLGLGPRLQGRNNRGSGNDGSDGNDDGSEWEEENEEDEEEYVDDDG